MKPHVLEFVCSRVVLSFAAALTVSCSPHADHQADFVPPETIAEQIDDLVETQMDRLGIHGSSLAIISNGEVRYAKAYGLADVARGKAVEDTTFFEAASLSKVAFAYFALREVDRGTIDLDMPLARMSPHPDINDERASRITARMVLSHTAGFPNWRWENENDRLDIKHEPGTAFRYSGEGFEYLALVLAKARETDKSGLEAIIQSDLATATGCDIGPWTYFPGMQTRLATGYVGDEKQADWKVDEPIVSASLFTTAKDYGCLLAAISTGKGLESDTFQEMVAPHVTLASDDDFRADFGLDAWGLGLARKPTILGQAITHGGVNEGFTAWFTILRKQRTGYVILTNSQEAPELNKAVEDQLLALALKLER